jgi:Domain of unknown function (DUF4407)
MRQLLINLSGARPEILVVCPTERRKFETMGWAVLCSGVLAVVSIWFALSSALGVNRYLALPFALASGLIIAGIERWLAASVPSDGRRRWTTVVPHLALAALPGVLVAAPLILQVFQPEINDQLRYHSHTAANSGLLIKLQALGELSSRSLALGVSLLLSSLLFVVIECLPLILKLTQQPGNYEAILQDAVEREPKETRRAFLKPFLENGILFSAGYRSLGNNFNTEPTLRNIWQRTNVMPDWGRTNFVPDWTETAITQPLEPLLDLPEESDDDARRDEALREMKDARTVANLDMRGAIALRYDDDDRLPYDRPSWPDY